MNILGKVRRLYHRDRLSLSEIERRTGLTRKTIRKWLNAPEGAEPNLTFWHLTSNNNLPEQVVQAHACHQSHRAD